MPADPTIRPLASDADYDACIALQRRTWGDDFRELVPPAMLMIAQKVGGVAAGAFRGDALIGFVYGLTGVRDGRLVHWSHMLAVDEAERDRGVGRRLKDHQRAEVRGQGVTRMYWTFDPLVARNAHLNLTRLGARVAEYHRNLYGEHPGSRTDSVIGSDRFVVVWDLEAAPPPSTSPAVRRYGGPVVTPDHPALPAGPDLAVAIPDDIQALKRTSPEEALAWRHVTRAAFEHCLARGYAVRGLVDTGGGLAYHLARDA